MKRPTRQAFLALALIFCALPAFADDQLQPFVMGSTETAGLAGALVATRAALVGAGFEVVGEYSPYAGAHLIAVTNDALRKAAAGSEHGGFGAVMRVAVTELGGEVQVSYTHPEYWAAAFRMDSDLAPLWADLARVLGADSAFGYARGFTSDELRRYHFALLMPYFDDLKQVAEFPSQRAAVRALESALRAGNNGTALVYRVDLPGATVFGVGLREGAGADARVMGILDQGQRRHTAHLPLELLVEDGRAYALHPKFRIAISFPELTMAVFREISDAPAAILEALEGLAD